MATYNIDNLNYGANIVDPVISVQRKLVGFDPDAMTVDAVVFFEITDGSGGLTRLGHILYNLPILSLTYDYNEIVAAVMTRLSTPEYLVP